LQLGSNQHRQKSFFVGIAVERGSPCGTLRMRPSPRRRSLPWSARWIPRWQACLSRSAPRMCRSSRSRSCGARRKARGIRPPSIAWRFSNCRSGREAERGNVQQPPSEQFAKNPDAGQYQYDQGPDHGTAQPTLHEIPHSVRNVFRRWQHGLGIADVWRRDVRSVRVAADGIKSVRADFVAMNESPCTSVD
jgi:hypothetical protein